MNLVARAVLGPRLRWQFDHWDEERLLRHQRRRLGRLSRTLARISPYYRDILRPGIALAEIPLMDKATMMAEFDRINSAGLHRDDLVSFRIRQEHEGGNELYPGGYSVGLSSGTSGNAVLTVLSAQERDRYGALLWARSGLPRGLRQRRILFALRTNNPAFAAVTQFGVTLVHVDYFTPVPALIELINAEHLNILAGPPSLLRLLAERRELITGPIDAVVSYAEELDPGTREVISTAFGVPVAEIYQGAEGLLAATCPAGRLHLNEDVSLVELADAGDPFATTRRVIVTDLYRTTQPFLRYQLNDLIEVGGRDCSCGSAFRVVEHFHGRSDEVLLLRDAAGRTTRLMPDYVRRAIDRASPDVVEYQAVQHSPDLLEVRLVLRAGADAAGIRDAIRRNLERWCERAGGTTPRLDFSARPPERNPRSGKLIRVVREFP